MTAKIETRKGKIGTAIFCFLFSLFAVIPLGATTVSGTIKKPDGTPINGAIEFTLSQAAKTTTPPVTFAPVKTTCAVASGVIAAGCVVQGNDTLDPAGTFYRVRVLDLNNLVVVPSANYTFSGAAVDLGSLPVTATDTLVPPDGSVTGNLNVTGNLTVGGSATFAGDPENFSHIRMLGLTADPATAATGSFFQRSDLNRIRFRTGGLEIFDGSQYLPVNASSAGTIELGANLSLPGLFSATFKRVNNIRLVDPFLWLESGVNAKINAAITDCGGGECRVLLPTNLTSGWPTDSTWPETAALLDLRGNAADPRLVGNFRAPFKFISRRTTDTAGQEIFPTVRALLFHDFGGENTGGLKDQYHAVAADVISSGRGEDQAIRARTTKYGVGDALGILATGVHYGNCTEAGGECTVGGRFAAQTGDVVMTATVSSAVDNGSTMTVNYSSPANEFSRGLGRLVVNTNAAKIHTTGSVSSISSAAPPVVTGSGTTWATSFGTGAHTDLCFSQNDDDAAGFKFVVPVRSVDSNTQLTLDYDPQGGDKAWPADNNGSSYRLYKCGEVTTFNIDGGSLTLTKGTADWAAGDTLEMPLGWAWHGAGVNVVMVKNLPSFQDWGLSVNSAGARAVQQGLVLTGSGGYQFGLSFNNTWAQSHGFFGPDTIGVRFQSPPTIGLQWTTTATGNNILLRAKDASGTTGDADLTYVTNTDKFAFLHSNTPANEIDFFPVQGQVIASIYSTRSYLDLGGTTGTVPGSGLTRVRSGNGGTPILATRNQANSANVNLLTYSTSDRLQLSQSGTPIEFVGGVASDGGGFKHRRVSTGSISASSSAAITVSWTTAFADSNYTTTCSVVEATAGTNSLRIHHLESVSTASVVVRVVNDDGSTAKTGTLHCTAVHD